MQPCCQQQHQDQASRGWRFPVWLSLLLILTSSATALAALLAPASTRGFAAESLETRQEQGLVETEDPRAILGAGPGLAGAWGTIP